MATNKIPFRDKLAALVGRIIPTSASRRVVASDGPAEFEIEVDITAAQLIAGSVTVMEDSAVPKGCKVFVDDYKIHWGSVAFASATDIRLSDKNSSPVDFLTVLVANTINAIHRLSPTGVTQTGVTQGAAMVTYASLGGTLEKGLQVRSTTGGPALSAGSTFRLWVKGYFMTA